MTAMEGDGIQASVTDSSEAMPHEFQFVDLSRTSTQEKKQNRTVIRSHVMKRLRAEQRRQTRPTKSREQKCAGSRTIEEADVETIWSESARRNSSQRDFLRRDDVCSNAFAANMAHNLNSTSISPTHRFTVLADMPHLRTYAKKLTPFLNECIDLWIHTIWPYMQPPSSLIREGICSLATDWFEMIHTSPSLFHAGIYMAGTLKDAKGQGPSLSSSPSMVAHKLEAIRQINLDLNKKCIPDATILAILCLIQKMEEVELQKSEEIDRHSPFQPVALPPPWREFYEPPFKGRFLEDVHFKGAQTIVALKGGFSGVGSLSSSFTFAHLDIRQAALHLRKPYHPFYELPEIAVLASDPSINLLAEPIADVRGTGFLPLLHLGLNNEILAVMVDMVNLTATMEAFLDNTLVNPGMIPLITRRNEIMHRLLSLMPDSDSNGEKSPETPLLACCRLAAMIYALASIYPIPMSTGTCRQLILQLQSAINEIRLKELYGSALQFYIWVLFLAGVGAERMPERLWFIGWLKALLPLQKVSSWAEIKHLAMSFLWMSSVCDEGGMSLWEEIAPGLR